MTQISFILQEDMLRRQEMEVAALIARQGMEQNLNGGVNESSQEVAVEFLYPNMLQQALDLFPALT